MTKLNNKKFTALGGDRKILQEEWLENALAQITNFSVTNRKSRSPIFTNRLRSYAPNKLVDFPAKSREEDDHRVDPRPLPDEAGDVIIIVSVR